MKITIDVGKEDVRNLIDSQDIAEALVEDFAERNPDFWAEKIAKTLPSVIKRRDLNEVVETIVEHLVFDIDIEQLVNEKIEQLFEGEVRQLVQDKIGRVLGNEHEVVRRK